MFVKSAVNTVLLVNNCLFYSMRSASLFMSPCTTRVFFQGPPGPPGPPGDQVCFLIGMVCISSFISLPLFVGKVTRYAFHNKCSVAKGSVRLLSGIFICTDFLLLPVTYRDLLVV